MIDQSREGRALWRIMQMSSHDHLCDLFEHEKVRMHFARVAGENLVSPDEKATAIGAYVFLGFLEAYGFGVAEGRLGQAHRSADRLHQGSRRRGARQRRRGAHQGDERPRERASNASTAAASTAKDAVIGAIHPHLLGQMVDGMNPQVRADAEATHITDAACITVHAALDAPLQFNAKDRCDCGDGRVLPTSYETLRRGFDELRYGQFTPYPLLGLGSLTQFDPSRVPAGKAILHLWDYVPYKRPDGRSWDEAKNEYADIMLGHMERFVAEHRRDRARSPRRQPGRHGAHVAVSFRRGDLHGIATTTYQSGAHRPTPDLGQYTVPGLDRFYLVGPFQHPGGGVFGAGRATAMKMFEALGLNFDKQGRAK